MRIVLALLVSMLLAGCATPRVALAPDPLLRDELFKPPSTAVSVSDVFAVNDEMRSYLATEVASRFADRGRSKGLYEALYSRNLLKIEYDATMTRTAAQTFAARSGNCLSLAIMTAALARELGLQVRYQAVIAEELWSRSSGIYFSSRHVNVTLGRRTTDPRYHFEESNLLTIDFTRVGELQLQRAWEIGEATVLAMYMNNRAAEILAAGNANDAYWWAREAIRQDPSYLGAFNTLGVIYRRVGHSDLAERVLLQVVAKEPTNTHALSNLALVYGDLGRTADAEALTQRLVSLQPRPPFHFFERGVAAMRRAEYADARDFFSREVERDPNYHEFQFWLAAAYVALGDYQKASGHLRTAIENSPQGEERNVYAAKLERVRAQVRN